MHLTAPLQVYAQGVEGNLDSVTSSFSRIWLLHIQMKAAQDNHGAQAAK